MAFIAGGYTATWNALPLGQIEDGIQLDFTLGAEEIRGDNYGDTVQDGVFRGGDCFLTATFLEWDLIQTSKALWYWSTTFGKIDDGFIGRLMSTFAKVLVLTKVTGPSASPTTLTANLAVLAPRFNVNTLLAPRLRRVPIRFQLLPFATAGPINQFFV